MQRCQDKVGDDSEWLLLVQELVRGRGEGFPRG